MANQSNFPNNSYYQIGRQSNKPALGNPLPAPSRSRRVATNLNPKRRGAPGSRCQASSLGKNKHMITKRIYLKYSIVIATILTAFGGGIAVGSEQNDWGSPIAVYRSYVEAVEKEDFEAAKGFWNIDDDKAVILDTTIGVWISSRRLNKGVSRRFGMEALEEFEFYRDDVTDQALGRTKKRLVESTVVINGNHAELKIKWQEDDGYPNTAFEFSGDDGVVPFIRVNGKWKIDTNAFAGLDKAVALFEAGSISLMMRDSVAVTNEAVRAMEDGQFTNVKELEQFMTRRLVALAAERKNQQKAQQAAPRNR
jgi:hypothetical protein